METQIIILLLFALRTISAQLMNIPPAPTLPDLDISSFPDYMQRLLANIPQINKVQSDPLYVPRTSKKPHTYGMKLRGDKGEIWNDISGNHLYINEIAPSKSIRLNFLHNKEDEPNNSLKTNDKSIALKNYNDYNQKLPPITTGKPEIMNGTQILPENHFKTTKPNFPSVPTLIPETPAKIPVSAEVQKDENGNYKDENTLTPQSLSEEIPAIVDKADNSAANPIANENSAGIPEESIEYTNGEDKIVQSFSDIIATMDSNKENRKYESSKTYGMKLKGDHGYVWNDLAKLGIHYNVGELETTYTSKPTVEAELKNTRKVIIGSEEDKDFKVTPATTEGSTDLKSANVNEERSTQETRPETSHIKPTAKGRETNVKDKPCKNITPELTDSLKKYIAKLVKEEVAKQLLGKNNTQIDTASSNGSNNKTPVADYENKKVENHYGSIIGNGKVKNVFVFHLNDKIIQSTVNDTTVLNKPVNEILNDIINKDENKEPDDASNALTYQPIESPETTVTMESNNSDKNPINNKEIERYKDTETITPSTAVTPEVDVTTVHSTAVDEGNQTTQTTIAVQDDATEANPNESATVTAIDSSQDDITNSTVTESNSMKPSNDSSLREVDNIGETPEATSVSNEGVGLGTNTEQSNSTVDSINTSTDSRAEIVDGSSNETQATQTASNEDAELTTITTIAEVGNVTSEGTVTAEPPEDMTTEVTMTETGSLTDVKDGIDEVSASSDISLPTSNS